MMQRIECTKCGEIVELTGETVSLPFVCVPCLSPVDQTDDQSDLQQTLKDYATNPELIASLAERGYKLIPVEEIIADVKSKPASEEAEGPSDEHEGATVENTTLLIQDLEKRLADAKSEAPDFDKINQGLVRANQNLQNKVDSLRSFAKSWQFQAERDRRDSFKLNQSLTLERRLTAFVKNDLDKLALKYRSALISLRETDRKNNALAQENFVLKARGFWGRVLNR